MISFLLALSPVAEATCATQTAPARLTAEVFAASHAMERGDTASFLTGYASMQESLRCLANPLDAEVATRLHLLGAWYHFIGADGHRDWDAARRSLQSVLVLDPGFTLDTLLGVPSTHPFRALLEEARALPSEDPLPLDGAHWRVDGLAQAAALPRGRPSVVQRAYPDGSHRTWVFTGTETTRALREALALAPPQVAARPPNVDEDSADPAHSAERSDAESAPTTDAAIGTATTSIQNFYQQVEVNTFYEVTLQPAPALAPDPAPLPDALQPVEVPVQLETRLLQGALVLGGGAIASLGGAALTRQRYLHLKQTCTAGCASSAERLDDLNLGLGVTGLTLSASAGALLISVMLADPP